MKTIHFNTGRKYTVHGQRISATLHDDGLVTFMDHDRGIDGEIMFPMDKSEAERFFNRDQVLNAYDVGAWKSTTRSRDDGMMRGGVNTKFVEGGV